MANGNKFGTVSYAAATTAYLFLSVLGEMGAI